MTSRVEELSSAWVPLRASVDAERFDRGRIGPYLIGNSLRATDFGEVSMALHDGLDRVVELEVLRELADTPAASPDGKLMPDLALAAQIEHANIARIIGAGLEGRVPYVVRPLVLGRTLAQFLKNGTSPNDAFAAGIVFDVAEGIRALAGFGPEPGACSIGGFDARDVFLGFDGNVLVLGSGTKEARAAGEDASARDYEAVQSLANTLGLSAEIIGAPEPVEMLRRLRREHREMLVKRRAVIGVTLRDRFDAMIQEERAFFGLSPLQ